MPIHTNRLAGESSPYLLQHAHNPVDWYPWGEEAFEKANRENKPVLVSIGYAACHWCHVMERESFENEQVASIMNENFVNIKVDREERPDVDHIYMDAVQAITGSGGWPLNVFLTPDRKPFYGGTYYPPQRAFNRASWTEVLVSVAQAFREKREEIDTQADQLTHHIRSASSFSGPAGGKGELSGLAVEEAVENIMKTADTQWGGFGRAPKFPQTFTISFLLQYAHIHGHNGAREQALLSLDKMMQGGLYDHAGGGFARYSTDTEWLAPHFEKMLYDNALLVMVLAEAIQLTGKEKYRETLHDTLAFVERELMHEDGGFFSALDADSEGEEGKFYVWQAGELRSLLGADAELFMEYYDLSDRGNWEGKNILRVLKPLEEFARDRGRDVQELSELLKSGREKLMEVRAKRVRPQLDDKVLLGWNALMNKAFSKAYAATGNEAYLDRARKNMGFLLEAFPAENGLLHHSWKNGEARHPGFLDDYADLVSALIELAQVSGDLGYLDQAVGLAEKVEKAFGEEGSPLFFYTHKGQKDILLRKKEVYDGATPSGNAVMAGNLYRLSLIFDRPGWRERAHSMVESLGTVIVRYPTSFGVWLSLLFELQNGTTEMIIIGDQWKYFLPKVNMIYISHKLVLASANPQPGYPLLADKAETREILMYVCKNYACRPPVTTIPDIVSLLEGKLF